MVKNNKRQRDIKTKLLAAICMLLVSSIMMVSSTYAWFTLSTAPEVTGISTSVGANGNLEIAILPVSGNPEQITTGTTDGNLAWNERNLTWGNLVDVSTYYGLDKITLYPAQLNITDAGTLAATPLKTPSYGADGRVTGLLENTSTGIYNSGTSSFYPDETGTTSYGVRAVGTASGMTERQLSYRNAQSAANTAMSLAQTKASQSLNSNGSALANIAIAYGTQGNDASFDKDDVAALRKIVTDLNADGGVLDQIETAYMQYILAYAASAATGTEDTIWSAVLGAVEKEGATLTTVTTALGTNVPSLIDTFIKDYQQMVTAVAEADEKVTALEESTKTSFTWSEISGAMTSLADPANMKVNGYAASDVKNNISELVSSVTEKGGLTVTMASGAGVYADIADHCGDYTASITIEEVTYSGVTLKNMKARMETVSDQDTPYLKQVGAAVVAAKAPADGEAGSMPMTDMYGYVIDMVFRTNAADSNLLLQTEAVDRIYEDNKTGVSDGEISTMGKGSTMTLTATDTNFSNEQVVHLMEAIKIVFFDPLDGNKVLAYAKLDADNATITAEGIVANIVLYVESEGTTSYTKATDTTAAGTYYEKVVTYTEAANTTAEGTYYTKNDDGTYTEATPTDGDTATYYTASESYVEATPADGDGKTYYTATTTGAGETELSGNDAVITALSQGEEQTVSVLVYLDGNEVTNADVAATGSTSVTGKMNLQFSSSATLTPMNYTELMEQDAE